MSGEQGDDTIYVITCKNDNGVSYHEACTRSLESGFVGIGWSDRYDEWLVPVDGINWVEGPTFEDQITQINYAHELSTNFEAEIKRKDWTKYLPFWICLSPGDRVALVSGMGKDKIEAVGTVAASHEGSCLNPNVVQEYGIPKHHSFRPVRWYATRQSNPELLEQLGATYYGLHMKTGRPTIYVTHAHGEQGYHSTNQFKQFLKGRGPSTPRNPSLAPRTQPVGRVMKTSIMQTTLRRSSNMVLEGVPGTGKTFAIKQYICKDWQERTGRTLVGQGREAYAITLHPATTYEDFVEGLRPVAAVDDAGAKGAKTDTNTSPGPRHVDDAKPVSIDGKNKVPHQGYFHVKQPGIHGGTSSGGSTFRMQDGFFLRACAEAANNPAKDYVVLLDEINRCNVPKVMGDLLTTIERSKRATWDGDDDNGHWNLSDCQVVTLPGSKRLFFVPDNVYVVATMNTTDRSVAPLDAALRRRFAFVRLWPMGFGPSREVESADAVAETVWAATASSETVPEFIAAVTAWWTLNTKLMEKGPDAMLGHSYLFDLAKDMGAERDVSEGRALVLHHWNFHILPQLVDVAVSNGLESELVQGGDKLGVLTKDLFPQDPDKQASGFKLTGSMPSSTGLLQVPTLTLVDHGSARGSLR